MNKRRLHHYWTKLRLLKPSYFLILAVIFIIIAIFSLRSNNEHMLKLRQAVYGSDINNTDVQGSLAKLQAYVVKHMNTNLSSGNNPVYPPLQLKYTYNRLVEQSASAQTTTNRQIYTDAQKYCESQIAKDNNRSNQVTCVSAYVQTHPVAKSLDIPAELYKFDFISPKWSPDLAGWSILAAVLSLIGFLKVLIIDYWFKKVVR